MNKPVFYLIINGIAVLLPLLLVSCVDIPSVSSTSNTSTTSSSSPTILPTDVNDSAVLSTNTTTPVSSQKEPQTSIQEFMCKADWMFGIAVPIILLTAMPVWWMVLYWGIGAWLLFQVWFVYRPCISLR